MQLSSLRREWSYGATHDLSQTLMHLDDLAKQGEHHPRHAVFGLAGTVAEAVLTRGSGARPALEPLVPLLVAALEADADSQGQPLTVEELSHASLLNAFELCGVELPENLGAGVRTWLPKVSTPKPPRTSYLWNKGFAALAYRIPTVYRSIAGWPRSEAMPFVAKARLGHDVQGLLAHLAAAVEGGHARSEVDPAWQAFLAAYPALWQAGTVDTCSLLWVGRIVIHDIGGEPLASTGTRVRNALAAAAS